MTNRSRITDPRHPEYDPPEPPDSISCAGALPSGEPCQADVDLHGVEDAYICEHCGTRREAGDVLDEIEAEAAENYGRGLYEDAQEDARC